MAARDEPSLEPFLPARGDGLVLSASDIETYRTCPLRYKFARVFRIPQEPTINQRFGILVHQVLERFHARRRAGGSLPELLGLLDAGWRRGGFGDSEEERQLRGKATAALTRYHARFQAEEAEPVWFERSFPFRLGPHLLRGRVDRVDRLPGGGYELIDYKTGRPKTAGAAARRRPAVAVRGRRARGLAARGLPAGLLLRARRPEGAGRRDDGRPVDVDHGDRRWRSPTGSSRRGSSRRRRSRPCSMCDYRIVCPAARRASHGVGVAFSPRAGRRRSVVAALAQEALELAGDHVARGERVGGSSLLVGGGLLEPLDERLHVGVALHGAG